MPPKKGTGKGKTSFQQPGSQPQSEGEDFSEEGGAGSETHPEAAGDAPGHHRDDPSATDTISAAISAGDVTARSRSRVAATAGQPTLHLQNAFRSDDHSAQEAEHEAQSNYFSNQRGASDVNAAPASFLSPPAGHLPSAKVSSRRSPSTNFVSLFSAVSDDFACVHSVSSATEGTYQYRQLSLS